MGASCQAEHFLAQDISWHLPVLLSLSMCSWQLSVSTKIKYGAGVVCGKPLKSYHLDNTQVSHGEGEDSSEPTFGEHFQTLINWDFDLEISSKSPSLFEWLPQQGYTNVL